MPPLFEFKSRSGVLLIYYVTIIIIREARSSLSFINSYFMHVLAWKVVSLRFISTTEDALKLYRAFLRVFVLISYQHAYRCLLFRLLIRFLFWTIISWLCGWY